MRITGPAEHFRLPEGTLPHTQDQLLPLPHTIFTRPDTTVLVLSDAKKCFFSVNAGKLIFTFLLFVAIWGSAQIVAAQEENADELQQATGQSNNPLSDLIGFTLESYYAPSLYGVEGNANSFLMQGVFIPTHRHLKLRHIIRASIPVETVPTGGGQYESGFGDFNIFDIFKLSPKDSKTEYGIGPFLVIPTANSDALGQGKWQTGVSFTLIRLLQGGSVIGTLFTWQTDFAGDSDRPGTNLAILQPNIALAIGKTGFYLSSTPQWLFDFENHNYLIPLSLGFGKVFTVNKMIVNASFEPQVSLYHKGAGQPSIQLFFQVQFQWRR